MDILSQEIGIVLVGSAFFLLIAVGVVVLFLIYQRKQLQLVIQKNDLQNRYEQEIRSVQLETQEQTLNRVGMEIHDNVGQLLSLAKMNLELSEDVTPKVISSKELISKAISELRNLSKTLNSNFINESQLADCFRLDLAMIEQARLMQTELYQEGDEGDLKSDAKLIIYRVGQELINNAIKHSEATELKIFITHGERALELIVQDNGKGMNMADISRQKKGTGIANLYTRSAMIGAKFVLSANETNGVKATLTFPYQV